MTCSPKENWTGIHPSNVYLPNGLGSNCDRLRSIYAIVACFQSLVYGTITLSLYFFGNANVSTIWWIVRYNRLYQMMFLKKKLK